MEDLPADDRAPLLGRIGVLVVAYGLPVAGSIGSLSQTMLPQMPSPQRVIRMRASPAAVSHGPVGFWTPTGDVMEE